ncbi:Crp/Fnr family transcriptional regulator [Agrobacterium vaccinii]|uniref:Crp/Fnr family transcriptional regulator n=1 Tax=Agrobacterium vaccinii TaxID=2735528 RepID=UPI001E2DD0BE|nr:Crp/Fnr family transcriptional regulator [Agrobacterium vaccinii]UHS62912.1 Crp/Fnr family transcriptional regulator [Agrobacterium vaccinii]
MDVNGMVKLNSKEKTILLNAPFIGAGDDISAAKLMEASTIVTVPARSVLFRAGDHAEHLYCVLNGYVRLYRLSKDGREADVRICGPGDSFNECLIFGTDRYHYHAQAAESCTVSRFDLDRLRTMVEDDPKIARTLMQWLSRSLTTTMDCVANDRLQTAPQRVANYLVTQGPRDATSFSLRLPFQKSVLAGKLGLAPEALSRAFSSLRDVGVIVRGRIIQVSDIAALKQL